ncbi:MAG: hypothetical protein RL291_252 [Pseudomonadota bacterium]
MRDFALWPFVLFCLVATGTPGPNNMINLAQGVRLGFWRALPFAFGTGFGIGSVLFAMALGLGALMGAVPVLDYVMRAATLAFLLYLAGKIVTAGPLGEGAETDRLGFFSGVAFQWINPKTWASAMTMVTTYLPAQPSLTVSVVAAVIFCVAGWMMQPVWIAFGSVLRGFLADPLWAGIFNYAMAGILLALTVPFLISRG